MKTLLLLIAISTFLTFNLSCRKDPVQSQETDYSLPGRRDYEWTVDTLKGEWNAYLSGIWGSGPDDVWAVGSAGATVDAIWHFDGTKWEQRWPRISSNLISVFGFAQNNVWATGAPGGEIFNFDGNSWKIAATLSTPGKMPGFNQIWGDSPDNIFAVGVAESPDGKSYKGIISRYNGNVWSLVDIPDYNVGFTGIRRGIMESSNYFLSATSYGSTGDINKIYMYDGKSLKELFSGQDMATVNEVDGQAFIVIGEKIYKYQDNKLVVWKDFTGTQFAGLVYGRSTKDFFSEGYNGLMHYNGTDIVTIYPTDVGVWAMAIFPNDIFFAGNKNGIPIMVHGKLK